MILFCLSLIIIGVDLVTFSAHSLYVKAWKSTPSKCFAFTMMAYEQMYWFCRVMYTLLTTLLQWLMQNDIRDVRWLDVIQFCFQAQLSHTQKYEKLNFCYWMYLFPFACKQSWLRLNFTMAKLYRTKSIVTSAISRNCRVIYWVWLRSSA